MICDKMKGKIITIFASILVISIIMTGSSIAGDDNGYGEPAPNSGDSIPDGSGFDEPNGPSTGEGPAPNSGDGIPDGPGW